MALKPDVSLTVALATAAVVYGVYSNALPPITDVRSAAPGNVDVQAAERSASWISAAAVAGISLITRDPTVFVVGGGMIIALAWWHRHADMVSPELGKAVPKFTNESMQVQSDDIQHAEDYDYTVS